MAKPFLLALALALALVLATPCVAASFDDDAKRAANDGVAAITVFVDVDFGGREDHAARQLTRAHAAFAAYGYAVVDVESYTENGDLQGFFVTYRKPSPGAN